MRQLIPRILRENGLTQEDVGSAPWIQFIGMTWRKPLARAPFTGAVACERRAAASRLIPAIGGGQVLSRKPTLAAVAPRLTLNPERVSCLLGYPGIWRTTQPICQPRAVSSRSLPDS